MPSRKITPVPFREQKSLKLDLDIVQISDLRKRIHRDYLFACTRIEFHQLFFVKAGCCVHTVDFKDYNCEKGGLLLMYPGQVQQFASLKSWEGYIVIFRPEFLLPKNNASVNNEVNIVNKLEDLPVFLQTNGNEEKAILELIKRMYEDVHLDTELELQQNLLRSELQTLFHRLFLICFNAEENYQIPVSVVQKRYKSFRDAVEKNYHRYHQICDYTNMLGYSEKSLNRSMHEMTGISAKKYLTQRIILEAKRLLAYTDLPISLIAVKLGFDEATNFSKFFRNYENCSPRAFRLTKRKTK